MKALRNASLFHDLGKVGVGDQVLVKAKKPCPGQLALSQPRLADPRKALELVQASAK